jgi:hypothetical protein
LLCKDERRENIIINLYRTKSGFKSKIYMR